MGYQIVGIDIELTEQAREKIAEQVGKVDKFLTRIPEENIFLRVALNRNQRNESWTDALVDLELPGDKLVGNGSASTPEHAVHLAIINLERQLNEHKQRTRPYI